MVGNIDCPTKYKQILSDNLKIWGEFDFESNFQAAFSELNRQIVAVAP